MKPSSQYGRSIDDSATRSITIVRLERPSPATPGSPPERRRATSEIPRLVLNKLREEGARATIIRLLAVAGIRRLSLDVYLMERERVLSRATPVPGVTVRALAESDIPAYLELRPEPADAVIARIRTGHCCIGAWRGGRLVATRWITTIRADLPDASFPLCSGVAYAYDAFTAPEERGCGIGAMVTAALYEHALSMGAIRVINAVVADNPSGQGLARSRSKPLGMLRFNQLWRWVIVLSQLPPGFLGVPVPQGSRLPSVPGVSDTA